MELTIITASIGRAEISRAYESLWAQTSPDWQWIICGDGVRPPDFGDKRVKALKLPHMAHESHMRNIGVEVASTDWVSFLDDDDYLHPEYVETLLDDIGSVDCDVIYLTQVGISGQVFPTRPGVIWGQVGISYACKRVLAQEFPFMPVPHEDFEQVSDFAEHGANFHWNLRMPLYYARGQRPEEFDVLRGDNQQGGRDNGGRGAHHG